MNKFILTTILILTTTPIFAQSQNIGLNNIATTYEESILKGTGQYLRGLGAFYANLGQYQYWNSIAKSQNIENWKNYVTTRWDLKDEWKNRHQSPNPLDSFEKKLDNAERWHALKTREQSLINSGILPKKPSAYMNIRGRRYVNRNDFVGTYDYYLMKLENQAKDIRIKVKELQEKRRGKQAIAYLAWDDKQSFYSRSQYFTDKQIRKDLGLPDNKPKFQFPEIDTEIDLWLEQLAENEAKQEAFKKAIKEKGNVKF